MRATHDAAWQELNQPAWPQQGQTPDLWGLFSLFASAKGIGTAGLRWVADDRDTKMTAGSARKMSEDAIAAALAPVTISESDPVIY